MSTDIENVYILLLLALPTLVLLVLFLESRRSASAKQISGSSSSVAAAASLAGGIAYPQPLTVDLPLQTVWQTIRAEISCYSFQGMTWRLTDELSAGGSAEELRPYFVMTARSLESGQDSERSFELLLQMRLQKYGPHKTRIDFKFSELHGKPKLLAQAAGDLASVLEQSLAMKLVLIRFLCRIINDQVSVGGIVAGVTAGVRQGLPPLPELPVLPELPTVPELPTLPELPGVVVAGGESKCPGCGQPLNAVFSFCLYCGQVLQA